MKTVVIQIGNSDDKLRQVEWSRFVDSVRQLVEEYGDGVHFNGCSNGSSPWQNACFVVEASDDNLDFIMSELTRTRAAFRQDSAAVTVGETTFV